MNWKLEAERRGRSSGTLAAWGLRLKGYCIFGRRLKTKLGGNDMGGGPQQRDLGGLGAQAEGLSHIGPPSEDKTWRDRHGGGAAVRTGLLCRGQGADGGRCRPALGLGRAADSHCPRRQPISRGP